MEIARARCRKCDAPITANENVVFPKAGGVEHLDCDKARRPLARAPAPTLPKCPACELPVLPGDTVGLVGHDLLHSACGQSGAERPP
jgi:hypothetical protein